MTALASSVTVSRPVHRLRHLRRWPAGTVSWLAAVISLVLATTAVSSRYLYGDSFFDLYAGRYIAAHGIPRVNTFSVTSYLAPWVDQQWLAHLLYYGAWTLGGYPALGAVSALLVTAGFAVLALTMARRGVPGARVLSWTAAALLACLGNTGIRAQSFGYLFFALTLWLMTGDGTSSRLRGRTWLVLPVLVLWANTHGSVLLGAALVAGHCGYRALRPPCRGGARQAGGWLALGVAAGTTVICTPYGTGVLGYYRGLLTNPALVRNIGEWAPPRLANPYCWGFFALITAMVAAVVLARRHGAHPDPVLCWLALILLALALTGIRFQIWFAFAAALLAADAGARAAAGTAPPLSRAFARATAAALGSLALAAMAVLTVTPASQFESVNGRRAVDVAAATGPGRPRILSDESFAAELLWLHPGTAGRIAFSASVEEYTPTELAPYFRFLHLRGPRWQAIARGYGVIVIASRQNPRLALAAAQMGGWQVVYSDRDGVVLKRQPRGSPSARPGRPGP